MKIRIACASFLLIISLFAVRAARCEDNFDLAQKNIGTLQISAFVTAGDVKQYFGDDKGLAEAAKILKSLGVTKVFLDTYRDGYITDKALLVRARDYFKSQGFAVGAGLTTTKGIGVGSTTHKYFLCYNYPETRNAIHKIVADAAPLFDELIVDDFFATECECPECAALMGNRTWPEYFRDTLVDVSREDIVGAAKKADPKINVIIKYPQWYDRYHRFGYDPARQRDIFDQVWVGTETRDPKKENVQQYEAFVNYTWMSSVAGGKMRGGWFDTINTSPDVYMEQAYQSILGGAKEITLFGYTPTNFTGEDLQRFSKEVPKLFKIAEAIKGLNHGGIFAYKPPNGDPGADHYIFDYMGMMGLPIVMTSTFPDSKTNMHATIFLSEHALADPDVAAKVLKHIQAGGSILMTSGFLAGMKDEPKVMAAAGYSQGKIKKVQKRMATEFVLSDGKRIKAKGYYMLGAVMEPDDPKNVLASADVNGKLIPVVTSAESPRGISPWHRIVVFNTRTYELTADSRDLTVSGPVFLSNLPDEIVNILRGAPFGTPGIGLAAPANVAYYFFKTKESALIGVENFDDTPAQAALYFSRGASPMAGLIDVNPSAFPPLEDVLTGEVFKFDEQISAGIPMAPHSLRLLKYTSK